VLAHAEMRALTGDKRELYARVAHLDGTDVVDAGGESWGAQEITSAGWRYVSMHPVPFVLSRGTVAFPGKGGCSVVWKENTFCRAGCREARRFPDPEPVSVARMARFGVRSRSLRLG
jgi:hypothetical protein